MFYYTQRILLTLIVLTLMVLNPAASFEAEHRLAIQINNNDPELHDTILTNISNLHKFYGVDEIDIEVVAYGPGVWLLAADNPLASRIESYTMQNVTFTACGNTLDAIEMQRGERPTLTEGVQTFEAGIARLIELQNEGYAYLSP